MADFADPYAVDELAVLVRERGEEMTPGMKGVVATTRVWLGVLTVVGVVAPLVLGGYACVALYRLFPGANFVLVAVQMPLTIGSVVVVKSLRMRIAKAVAARLSLQLGAVGGSTSAAMSLLPRHIP